MSNRKGRKEKSMEKKYQLGTEENKQFLKAVREDLLRFGKNFPAPGGSSYYLDEDGNPVKSHERETWITSRMAHVYSIGTLLGFSGSDELADAAVKGLKGELHDEKNGGWYAGLTEDNEILAGKQCYAHAFVILAGSSAMLAGRAGAKELLEQALATYDAHFWNEEEGLACDTWNTEFTELEEYRGLNANMHTVEAFLAAADALEDETYRNRAGRIIASVAKWASENEWRIPEHYTSDWKPELEYNKDHPTDQFKPYGATPGHGIEWARLITQWALSDGKRNGGVKQQYIEAAEQLYHRAVADAWNADGAEGFVYTTDWAGKPVVQDRMHWVLAEAINTSAVLHQTTKKQEYADDFAKFLAYLDAKMIDHVKGSWFHQLNEKNEVIGTVWPGKPDVYHALQAMMIPYCQADTSIATAIAKGLHTNLK